MNTFIDYIEESCAGINGGEILYKYKRKLLDEITERANEITGSGLKDEKVLCDLIKDEYPDIKENYKKFALNYRKERRAKSMRLGITIGSVAFVLVLIITYLSISFITQAWRETWLIVVGGIFALIIFLLFFAIKKLCKMKKVFHPIARILTAICIMLVTVFAFLFTLMLFDIPHSWTIVIAGIILLFIADAVFATVTKQKFVMINYLLYIPAICSMLYIILGAYSVLSWNTGWLIIIMGVLADIAIMLGVLADNQKYKYHQEVEDVWSES